MIIWNILKYQEEFTFAILDPNRDKISYDRYTYYKKMLEEIANASNLPLP